MSHPSVPSPHAHPPQKPEGRLSFCLFYTFLPEFWDQVRLQAVESSGESDQPPGLVTPVLALQIRRRPLDMALVPAKPVPAPPAVTQAPGPVIGAAAVYVGPPLAPEAMEPLGLQCGVGQVMCGGRQVLKQNATLLARGLEEDLRGGRGQRLGAEGDGRPGDAGLALQETPHQCLVPLQVVLQVLLSRLIALQHHVEEVGSVC